MTTRPLTDEEISWVEAHQRTKSRTILAVTVVVGLLTAAVGLIGFVAAADLILNHFTRDGAMGLACGAVVWLMLGAMTFLLYDTAARNAPEESSPTAAQRLEGTLEQRRVGAGRTRRLVTSVGGSPVLAHHVTGLDSLLGTEVAVWVVTVGHRDEVVIAVEGGWSPS